MPIRSRRSRTRGRSARSTFAGRKSTAPRSRRSGRRGARPRKHSRGATMPKFLVQANYKPDAIKGLLKEGGTKRRSAVEQMAAGFGGRVEAFYFAFGDADAFVVLDAPDNI